MEISVEKRKEEEFLAKICQGGRVTVPLTLRERLSLNQGAVVRVRIQKDEPDFHAPAALK